MKNLLNSHIVSTRIELTEIDKWTILSNLYKVSRRLRWCEERKDAVAVVGYGPSLQYTWNRIKNFKTVITTSGAHNFLIEKKIIPSYHVECDPRAHKTKFTAKPHPEIKYLIGSSAHPAIINNLLDFDVSLWNFTIRPDVEIPAEEIELPTYGDVGQQACMVAKVLGYRDLHLFGFDYDFNVNIQHAGEHGNELKEITEYYIGPHIKIYSNNEFIKNLLFFNILMEENTDLSFTIYGNGALSKYLDLRYEHNADEPEHIEVGELERNLRQMRA